MANLRAIKVKAVNAARIHYQTQPLPGKRKAIPEDTEGEPLERKQKCATAQNPSDVKASSNSQKVIANEGPVAHDKSSTREGQTANKESSASVNPLAEEPSARGELLGLEKAPASKATPERKVPQKKQEPKQDIQGSEPSAMQKMFGFKAPPLTGQKSELWAKSAPKPVPGFFFHGSTASVVSGVETSGERQSLQHEEKLSVREEPAADLVPQTSHEITTPSQQSTATIHGLPNPADVGNLNAHVSNPEDDAADLSNHDDWTSMQVSKHDACVSSSQEHIVASADPRTWFPQPAGGREKVVNVPVKHLQDYVEAPESGEQLSTSVEDHEHDRSRVLSPTAEASDGESEHPQATVYATTQDWPPSSPALSTAPIPASAVNECDENNLPPDSDDDVELPANHATHTSQVDLLCDFAPSKNANESARLRNSANLEISRYRESESPRLPTGPAAIHDRSLSADVHIKQERLTPPRIAAPSSLYASNNDDLESDIETAPLMGLTSNNASHEHDDFGATMTHPEHDVVQVKETPTSLYQQESRRAASGDPRGRSRTHRTAESTDNSANRGKRNFTTDTDIERSSKRKKTGRVKVNQEDLDFSSQEHPDPAQSARMLSKQYLDQIAEERIPSEPPIDDHEPQIGSHRHHGVSPAHGGADLLNIAALLQAEERRRMERSESSGPILAYGPEGHLVPFDTEGNPVIERALPVSPTSPVPPASLASLASPAPPASPGSCGFHGSPVSPRPPVAPRPPTSPGCPTSPGSPWFPGSPGLGRRASEYGSEADRPLPGISERQDSHHEPEGSNLVSSLLKRHEQELFESIKRHGRSTGDWYDETYSYTTYGRSIGGEIPEAYLDFVRDYPLYRGNVKQFLSVANMLLDHLDEYPGSIHQLLWDDFLLAYTNKYLAQKVKDAFLGQTSPCYLRYWYESHEQSFITKGSLGPHNIGSLHHSQWQNFDWEHIEVDKAQRADFAKSRNLKSKCATLMGAGEEDAQRHPEDSQLVESQQMEPHQATEAPADAEAEKEIQRLVRKIHDQDLAYSLLTSLMEPDISIASAATIADPANTKPDELTELRMMEPVCDGVEIGGSFWNSEGVIAFEYTEAERAALEASSPPTSHGDCQDTVSESIILHNNDCEAGAEAPTTSPAHEANVPDEPPHRPNPLASDNEVEVSKHEETPSITTAHESEKDEDEDDVLPAKKARRSLPWSENDPTAPSPPPPYASNGKRPHSPCFKKPAISRVHHSRITKSATRSLAPARATPPPGWTKRLNWKSVKGALASFARKKN